MGLGYGGVIDSLHDDLGRALLQAGTQKAALETTSWLGRSRLLTKLLGSLHENPAAAAACARESYQHPLGFFKLMLINAAPLFELRAHVWWPDSTPGVDHIHNHRFAFASAIVRGSYDMQTFRVDRAGTPVMEYREMVSAESGWRLQAVGPAWLRVLTSATVAEGTGYALTPGVLHRIRVPTGSPCVSLLLRTTMAGATTRVFASPGDEVPRRIPLKALSGDDYRRQLAALLRLLAA